MRATAMVLARVEDQKFYKAMEGIRNGAYQMTITRRTQEEVRGFVKRVMVRSTVVRLQKPARGVPVRTLSTGAGSASTPWL
jgi:hypothetical protein